MSRLVRVSMTTGQCGCEPLPERMAGLGGRGLASALVAENVPPSADPMGPGNILVFSPGLLAGTRCANANRMSVGFKSPLTGLLHEANTGGVAGSHLARLGIAALVIEGKARDGDSFQLEITPDLIRLVPATVRGLGNAGAAKSLAERHGGRCSCITIGPAGEMGLAASSIAFTDGRQRPTRHAGGGGGGAVMGTKGLKAVIITPPETDGIPMHDAAAFSRAARHFAEALTAYRHTAPGQGGTAACAGCIVGCPSPSSPKSGKSGKWPGYETLFHVDGYTADEDAACIARFGELCDEAGVDSLEVALGLAALQRAGKLEYRNALELTAEIGRGTAAGRLLASGARAVAETCGLSALDCLPRLSRKAETSRENPADEAGIDTLGICRFAAGALRNNPKARTALTAMLGARYGTLFPEGWLDGLGSRVLALENAFNARVLSL